jgi:hypothetical protein
VYGEVTVHTKAGRHLPIRASAGQRAYFLAYCSEILFTVVVKIGPEIVVSLYVRAYIESLGFWSDCIR